MFSLTDAFYNTLYILGRGSSLSCKMHINFKMFLHWFASNSLCWNELTVCKTWMFDKVCYTKSPLANQYHMQQNTAFKTEGL